VELKTIEEFFANPSDNDNQPMLMTGFNRRFSPFIVKLKDVLEGHNSPLVMNYQLNSEFLSPDHWMRGEEGGGRNIGEACHIYDLFTFLTNGRTVDVKATAASLLDATHARNENFSTTIAFDEGSVGSLTYTTLGSSSYPKEILHVFVDERVFVLTDYLKLESFGPSPKSESGQQQDKGHFQELQAFFRAIERGDEWPIPLWQQVQAVTIALEVERQIWDERAD
jgi:predicted dehydrogenase